MSSAVAGCISNKGANLVQLTSFSLVQDCRTEKIDNNLKLEITKLVSDLNHETAQYCTLAVALGGSQDTLDLRDELKHIRQRAFDIARQNKNKLIPALRKKNVCEDDAKQLERLYNMYSSSLELLEVELFQTLRLQKMFPLQSGVHFLINVGTSEPFLGCKSQINISEVSIQRESEEISQLEKDLADVRDLLFTIYQKIAVQPWAADAYNETSQQEEDCKSESSSNGSTASSIDITMVEPNSKKKRWLCVVIMTFVAVLLSAAIIGVCLGLLK
ncbi:regulator of G-protein signaling 9-binding protein-like [Saccostrea echinata]|uniref:regulator of G-protein signaling 9-binding protein-like n=1 Tax=Saccostrea echinata TaxID=191078 RepID=UPI002A7FF7EB|nr:regulator of G-protein signaling 9-binding protein-like [Saccostrea echinata]